MDIDFTNVYQRLIELGNEWAKAKYHADQLDDATKPLLSQLGHDSGQNTATARLDAAYRHGDYKKHCEEKNEAKYLENKARIKYNAAQTWVDVQRTIAATERAANKGAV